MLQSGLAQQWYDELDDLAAPEPESKINVQDDNLDKKLVVEDEKVPFSVGVFTSPRTSEVCLSILVLYGTGHLIIILEAACRKDRREKRDLYIDLGENTKAASISHNSSTYTTEIQL